MRIKYLDDCVKKGDMPIILKASPILEEYSFAGYVVTVRQLHYQFVARGYLPNEQTTYNAIGRAIKRGRLGGLVDWDCIEDRTRRLNSRSQWRNPAHLVSMYSQRFHVDHWKNQPCRVEVWSEKDAVIGVIDKTCKYWDCSYYSCRGYPSISGLHSAALRIKEARENGQGYKIIYLGDHDPSGLNMGESTRQKLREFGVADCDFQRIALSMEQIERFNLPPNLIKDTDRRSPNYREEYGEECWELDALPPQELNKIIETAIIASIGDMDDFEACREKDVAGREQLRLIAKHFDKVYRYAESIPSLRQFIEDDD